MDSMKSLNRSLPSSNQPSEALLRAFKTAAVSVTNIYREAASGQAQARASGYQDALDDLLAFLDQRNLGLGDGEGWSVRQWATERLDDRPRNQPTQEQQEQQGASESEDDKDQEKEKSPSPTRAESSPIRQSSVQRQEATKAEEPEIHSQDTQKVTVTLPTSEVFTFESSHAYPRDVDMQTNDTTNSATSRGDSTPRSTRHFSRKNSNKSGHRNMSTRILGIGSGSKRKFPYGEFFDISGIGDGKDISRSSAKRGRMG